MMQRCSKQDTFWVLSGTLHGISNRTTLADLQKVDKVLVRNWRCWSGIGGVGLKVDEVLVRNWRCWSEIGGVGQEVDKVLVRNWRRWSEIGGLGQKLADLVISCNCRQVGQADPPQQEVQRRFLHNLHK
jgi:hypothetical protein